MDDLGVRPVWSMGGSDLLSTLDALDAQITQLQSYRLQVIARIEDTGYAQELGARDAVDLLSFRYRLDRTEAWRDVHLSRALPKYPTITNALQHGIKTPADTDTGADGAADTDTVPAHDTADLDLDLDTGAGLDTGTGCDGAADADANGDAGAVGGDRADAGAVNDGSGHGVRLMRPAQAAAIVSALERVRSRVPVEHLDVAEQQLVSLAGHLSARELRSAARKICDLLDSDGPEPEEHKAYARESLSLSTADNGVKFRGYLANENAELLRAIIHAGARPHKTTDGELDPRSREKRQADALTTALTTAATSWDTGTRPSRTAPSTPAWDTTTKPSGTARSTPARDTRTPPSRTARSAAARETGNKPSGTASAAAAREAGARPSSAAQSDPADTTVKHTGTRPSQPTADALPYDTDVSAAAMTAAPSDETPNAPSAATPNAPSDATPDAPPDASDDEPSRTSASAAAMPDASSDATSGVSSRGDVARASCSGGGTGSRVPGYGAKANITVTIDLEDLKAATAGAVGDLVYGDGLSAAAIRRLACDANIIPLVLGSNSEPLDVGRSERLVTRSMRKALNARDKGCVV
ncbi:DUF222 domain-containing protein [Kribbella sp. NPDC054772]